jgi:hypothetical protein
MIMKNRIFELSKREVNIVSGGSLPAALAGACQSKVKMSAFQQSRDVLFVIKKTTYLKQF